MLEKSENSITEEKVIAKVRELMETLDEVKKYEVLANHFNKFALIITSSIVVVILTSTLLPYTGLLAPFEPAHRFFLTFLLVLIPIVGVVIGVVFVKKQINSVKTGEWKYELSRGFPSALKMLSEMNFESYFNTISAGGLNYVMYGLVKGVAYWIITYFVAGLMFNLTTYMILHQTQILGGASMWTALLITFGYLKKELSKRFNEIRAIEKLQCELRRLSHELRNTEL
ncbi:MAG: hypothetical protein N3D85_06035 [Candidatus Bathyarchaeota archaeon]|nr:hypothetical protein [Candidatus Bathyarchaeota archaeon]